MAKLNNWKLEEDLREPYDAWVNDPSPHNAGFLVSKLAPTINRSITAYAHGSSSPNIKGRAKRITLQALKTYDPKAAKLSTHVTNNLQSLRRVFRQQNEVLKIPERISYDRAFLNRAEKEFEDRVGRIPSTEELVDVTNMPLTRIEKIRKYHTGISEGLLMSASEIPENTLPAEETDNTFYLAKALHGDLSPIDQTILEHTLGLFGRAIMDNRTLAARLKLSPGAVSQRKAGLQQQINQLQGLR